MSGARAVRAIAHTPTPPSLEFRSAVPPFGVYRLASDDWRSTTYETLAETEQSVHAYLFGLQLTVPQANRFKLNDAYAATHIQRRDMIDRADRHGIQFDRVLERVGNLAASSGTLTVPIAGLAWQGGNITAVLDQASPEYDQLLDHSAEVARIIREAGMPDPPVRRPHHVSLYRYAADKNTPRTRLVYEQRLELLEIVGARLAQVALDAVDLEATVVGSSYTDQFTLDEWLLNERLRAEAYFELQVV